MPTSVPHIHTACGMTKGRCPAKCVQSLSFGASLHSLYIYLCVFERLLIGRPQSNILKKAKRFAVVLFGSSTPFRLRRAEEKEKKD
jgi:hypothetical protein